MCDWCLAYCTGVVLNTARESATPDSQENKQADAGSRRFRRHFLCGALLCNFSSTEHEGLCYLHIVQRECSAEPFMRSILSLTIFYQDANSVLLLAHFCTAVLLGSIRKTLCLKLFMIRACHANLCLRFVFFVFCFLFSVFVFWCLCVAQKTSTSLIICSLYS